MKEWRANKAQQQGVPHFQVLHQKTLIQIVVNLPDSLAALRQIKGIGKKLSEKYGDELVALVGKYRKENDIDTVILPESSSDPVERTSQSRLRNSRFPAGRSPWICLRRA